MNRTILLADDSSTIRKIVELTFQDSPIEVQAVGSGAEALRKLHELQPDLLLADVIMPEPAGYELCRQVKQSGRPIPVVLMTGAFEVFDADRARACGADDRLVKPFESQMLRSTVERLLSASVVPTGVRAVLAPEVALELDELSAELEQSRPGLDAVGPGAGLTHDDGGAGTVEDGEFHEVSTEWQFDEAPRDPGFEILEAPAAPEPAATRLTHADIEALADAVVRRLSGDVIRELAREMLPEIATTLVRERIRELEGDDG